MMSTDWILLPWTGKFTYTGLSKKRTIGDGSCLFHAIADAYNKNYQQGHIDGNSISKTEFIRRLRFDLADQLASPVDPLNPNGPRYYDVLSRGKLHEISAKLPQYTLENMQKELRVGGSVDNVYNEFLSMLFDKDIYLLDGKTQDVYVTGNDKDILYKGRESIVILVTPGHYELVGIYSNNNYTTLFKPTDPFILYIQERMKAKFSVQ